MKHVNEKKRDLPVRVPVNPGLQTGVHLVPVATFSTQSPLVAFAMEGNVVQEVLTQEPVTVHTAFEHEAERVPANPEAQTGVQASPLRRKINRRYFGFFFKKS